MRPRTSPRTWIPAAAVLAAAALLPSPAFPFGKNKIAYERFDWQLYPSPHFDVYYYPEEEALLEQVVSFAESQYVTLSELLDHEIKFRIPLILYRTHGEFEQTNIILQFIPQAVAAFAEPLRNRMVLPIDSPPDELYKLIGHELVHIFEYSIFFQESLGRTFRASPPLWLMEGLASHLSRDETNLDIMIIRDAVVNGLVPPIEALNVLTFLTYRFGAAVFRFIESEFGPEGLRNFLWEYRKVLVANNVPKALKEALGMEVEEFNRRFQKFLRQKYLPELLARKEPEDYGREIGLKEGKKKVTTFSPTISPSGELAAVLTLPKDELDLVVISTKDGEMIRNLTKGFTTKYEYIIAEIFQGHRDLSWSPEGDRIAFFARKENRRVLFLFDALTGKEVQRLRPDIDSMASPAFSPDGQRIAFSGNREGRVDLFEVDLESGAVRNLTDDEFHDSNPEYSPDGKSVAYNRRIGDYEKIFLVEAEDPSRKTQLTFAASSDIQPSFSRDGRRIYYASDGPDGIYNIHGLDLETGDVTRYTDVIGGCFNPVELAPEGGTPHLAFTSYFRGQYRLYKMPLREPEQVIRASEAAGAPLDLEPFRPPLALSLDEDRKGPYTKAQFSVEGNPAVYVGVADDGTLVSDSDIVFSDLLGDQRLRFRMSSVSSFSNFDALYLNLKHRFNYGFRVLDFRDFFLAGSGNLTTADRRQEFRVTGGEGLFSYPFNKFYRADFSLGYFDRSNTQIFLDSSGFLSFLTLDQQYPLLTTSLSGDTVRFKEFGPLHGHRFDFTTAWAPTASGELGAFTNYYADYRAYGRLTSRSLVGMRLFTAVSNGETKIVNASGITGTTDSSTIFAIGGLNQLRGYSFREFFGDRVAFLNLELRFPLVDELRLPFGSIRSIRGLLFWDVGAAWFRGDQFFDDNVRPPFGDIVDGFDFWDSGNSRLGDGRSSYGMGFYFDFGPFDLNWTFSRRLENSLRTCTTTSCQFIEDPNFDDRWRSAFYIGRAF
ncbi:MAG: PD40 domain-containing protein [Acidobacteria bacterium]|nr:PD40 domain-containing protein [Acidobacteriota bacterium]